MSDVIKYTENYVNQVVKAMDISPSVLVEDVEGVYVVTIEGDNLNFLIGYRGDSLEGLQQLLALSLFKEFDEWQQITVDINGYREKKKEKLENMSKSYIDRVRFFKEEVHLPPMSPYERKLIHEFVSTYDDVESYSEEEGRERHLVLKPIS